MSIVLSLQGSMAVGKTSALQHVEKALPSVHISYEDPKPLLKIVKNKGYDYDTLEGFVAIQQLFIHDEIARYASFTAYPVTVLDLRVEEIECYTLHMPKAMGKQWDTASLLTRELDMLRRHCKSRAILFLDAAVETLYHHKTKDTSRRRGSFNRYVTRFLQIKRAWFAQKDHVEFLDVTGFSKRQTGEAVVGWVQQYL